MQLSSKQNEYIVNATHRWNIKSGAVRSGKSYVDTAFVIPFRIRERAGKAGLNVILGVSKESIERNVLQPMRRGCVLSWGRESQPGREDTGFQYKILLRRRSGEVEQRSIPDAEIPP